LIERGTQKVVVETEWTEESKTKRFQKSLRMPDSRLVDVAGIEPATPCLQKRAGKTLKRFAGVAYTNHERNLGYLIIPGL